MTSTIPRRTHLSRGIRVALRRRAVLQSVVPFFYGKQINFDILYPGPGFPCRVRPTELLLRGLPELVGGPCSANRIEGAEGALKPAG